MENDSIPTLPSGFKIMFAGNLGEAQNIENIFEVALQLHNIKNIKWIFLGDGRKKPWMEAFIEKHKLEDTIYLLGRHPIEKMPLFFTQADVMLVSLCDEVCFNLTLPAKVQAYMSCSKPIIGFMNGEGNTIINEAHCGTCVDANDIDGFKNAILEFSQYSKDRLTELGDNGYRYYLDNFNKQKLMDQLENTLLKVVEV